MSTSPHCQGGCALKTRLGQSVPLPAKTQNIFLLRINTPKSGSVSSMLTTAPYMDVSVHLLSAHPKVIFKGFFLGAPAETHPHEAGGRRCFF